MNEKNEYIQEQRMHDEVTYRKSQERNVAETKNEMATHLESQQKQHGGATCASADPDLV